MERFNPEMLLLARGSRGLSQADLAREIGWRQDKISKIENGLIRPTEDEVLLFADHLEFLPEFFYQGDVLAGFGSCCTHHRKRKTTPLRQLKTLHDQINVRRIQVDRLLRSAEIVQPRFPAFDVDELGSPERAAQSLRATWKVPRGPIRNLVSTVEHAGGIVVQFDFPTPKIDAVSQWATGLPPLFFLDRAKPVDRWRLTLAHEIGHIVMHSAGPSSTAEEEADRFAAEFLMPEAEIRQELIGLNIEKAARLKLKWRVSMQALIVRARRIGAIPQSKYNSLCVQISQQGWRKNEPNQLEEEQPSILSSLVSLHLEDLGYSIQDLSETLMCTERRLQSDYLEPAPRLRIVR